MSEHIILTKEQYLRMPWKNGKGKTLELFRKEDKSGVAFRISQARVIEPGIFSDFSGFDRNLVLIKGKGIRLTHKNDNEVTNNELTNLLDIATFNGGDLTSSELIDGGIEDLNIMVRSKLFRALVQAIYSPSEELNHEGIFSCFYANEACEMLVVNSHQKLIMPLGSLLTMKEMESYTLESGSGVFIAIKAN